jgi:hypothetical protein
MHLTYPVAEEMTGEEAQGEIETIHSTSGVFNGNLPFQQRKI